MKKIYSLFLVFFVSLGSMGFSEEKALYHFSPDQEYNLALNAFQNHKWEEVQAHGKKVINDFPTFPFLGDIHYFVALAYYARDDYEMANFYLSEFLKKWATPKYFEDALIHKFQIAEKFQEGAGKHILGLESLPKWVSAWDDAYEIYDEVITTLPKHDVSAKALFNKGQMLLADKRYKEAIDAFQTLIRRFPKHFLTPESYLEIAKVYLQESKKLFPDRDFLEQARLNLKRFKHDFPSEVRLVEVESVLVLMQDRYAKDLWETAAYYLKKKKVESSLLYYISLVRKYPESKYAKLALDKIQEFKKLYPHAFIHVHEEDLSTLTSTSP